MSENTNQNQYRPRTVTPPGETIGELLEERSVRQTELATRMGVTPKFVNELIAGKASITPNTALALERALNLPAEFWLAREAKYQEALARESAYENLVASPGSTSYQLEICVGTVGLRRTVTSQR
jgi:addiction module HigA family antidote